MDPSTSQSDLPRKKEATEWSLNGEVKSLFKRAKESAFPRLRDIRNVCWTSRDYNGVYQCDSVLSLWPKLRHTQRQSFERPKDIGEVIKKHLKQHNLNCMFEEDPVVYGVGFVTIKLSGTWLAKNLLEMITVGINTWIPKGPLTFKKTIINSMSCDLPPLDLLRRQCLIMSELNMMEYAKLPGTTSAANLNPLPNSVLEQFQRKIEDGSLIICKNKHRVLGTDRLRPDSNCCLGSSLQDMAALWEGLVQNGADSIFCVGPNQQNVYANDCFHAAKDAGWSDDNTFFIGFKTCGTSAHHVLSIPFYDPVLFVSLDARKAAGFMGYTEAAFIDCVLIYTILKDHRLADCTFGYNEMCHPKGNTFVNLLMTRAKVLKLLQLYPELKLGSDEVLLSDGVERELGVCLLMFTDLITESCGAFLPHLLCGYLHNLSKKFMSFCEPLEILTHTQLLLCKATDIVMEKGFQLLGITQTPKIKAVSSLDFVPPVIHRVLKPNIGIRSRFELLTAYVSVEDNEFKNGDLWGWISITDESGLRPEGWERLLDPYPAHVSLFCTDYLHSVRTSNNRRLKIGNLPKARHSVPLSSSELHMSAELYASSKEGDELFQVCNFCKTISLEEFWGNSEKAVARFLALRGYDGVLQMYFVLLRDALDSTIELKVEGFSGQNASGTIVAYYGDLECGDDSITKSCYKCVLVENVELLVDGPLTLTRSKMAVPKEGKLVIQADVRDRKTGQEILCDSCEIDYLCTGKSNRVIRKSSCSIEVTINCLEAM